MRTVDYGELALLLAIAETGSLTAAARRLGLSPSTASDGLRRLETRIGVRLVQRNTRRASLTSAGEGLAAGVSQPMLRLRRALERACIVRADTAGRLRLSLSTISASLVVAPVLASFHEAYPHIEVDAQVGGSARDADAVIRHAWRGRPEARSARVLHRSRNIVVAAPAYLARRGRPSQPEDLAGHDCLRFRIGARVLPWAFARDGDDVTVAVEGPLVSDDMGVVVAACRAGLGLSYMLESYVADDLAAGRLIGLLSDATRAYAGYRIAWPEDPPGPILAAFLDHLRGKGLIAVNEDPCDDSGQA